jgi:hypothetical protein
MISIRHYGIILAHSSKLSSYLAEWASHVFSTVDPVSSTGSPEPILSRCICHLEWGDMVDELSIQITFVGQGCVRVSHVQIGHTTRRFHFIGVVPRSHDALAHRHVSIWASVASDDVSTTQVPGS